MSFYGKPFTTILKDNELSPTDKLVFMVCEGWWGYYKKTKPNLHPTVYMSQICTQLCLEVSDIINSLRKLSSKGYLNTVPEKNKSFFITGLSLEGEL